jgi:hypothetical protein
MPDGAADATTGRLPRTDGGSPGQPGGAGAAVAADGALPISRGRRRPQRRGRGSAAGMDQPARRTAAKVTWRQGSGG